MLWSVKQSSSYKTNQETAGESRMLTEQQNRGLRFS